MTSSSNLGNLKTETWELLQGIADRFEAAWKKAGSTEEAPDLGTFLPPPESPLRSTALHELVKSDLEARWRKGNSYILEHYLERFPELGTVDKVSPQLIYEEYCTRQKYGDRPSPESYESRFPVRYPDFQRLLKDQPLPTMATPVPTPSYKPGAAAAAGGAPAPRPNAPADVPDEGEFLPNHKRIRKIGAGGFGEVWEAEAPGGVPVGVKMLFRSIDDEESKRELESLEAVKKLRHPYLLSTQNFQVWKNRLYIVMELADDSLRGRLKECRKTGMPGIPLSELLNYFREAADALDFLHSKNVLHRDIKPDNILTLQQHAKLADFGLARLHESDRSMQASGSGTPAYMPPEVWNGKVSPASDQYALALTYAELRLDRRIYTSRDMMQLMMDHLQGTPDLDPLPPEEQEVLHKALAKDHNKRHGNCKEFVQALYTALAPIIGRTAEFSLPTGAARPAGSGAPSARTDMDPEATRSRMVNMPGPGSMTQDENFETMAKGQNPAVAKDRKPSGAWKTSPDAEVMPKPTKARPEPKAEPKKRNPIILVGVMLAFVLVGAAAMAVLIGKGDKDKDGKDRDKDKDKVVLPDGIDFLPPRCEKVGDKVVTDSTGLRAYDRVDYVFPDSTRVRFILIPYNRQGDPKTFYMMEDKVNVALFEKFATEEKGSVRDKAQRWKEGGQANGVPTKNTNKRHPVFNVEAEDAWRFAIWMGGELPTMQQWDKAAGEFEQKRWEGPSDPQLLLPVKPARTDGTEKEKEKDRARYTKERDDLYKKELGVDPTSSGDGPQEMAPPGEKIYSRSWFGVRYMAGNGNEFTRDLVTSFPVKTATVPLAANYVEQMRKTAGTDNRASVIYRGQSYQDPLPYQFPTDSPGKETRDRTGIPYIDVANYISFRVVLEQPAN